jgi:hypothetical protein
MAEGGAVSVHFHCITNIGAAELGQRIRGILVINNRKVAIRVVGLDALHGKFSHVRGSQAVVRRQRNAGAQRP